MTLYVRPKVICDIAGLSKAQVMRDLARLKVSIRKRPPSNLNYYSLSDVSRAWGREFSNETISRPIERHNRPAAIEE